MKTEPTPELNPELIPELNPESNPILNSESNPELNPELNPESNPEFNPGSNPELNQESNPELNLDTTMSDPSDACENTKGWLPFSFVELNSPFPRKRKTQTANKEAKALNKEKFPCPNCKSVYNRFDNLTQHLKNVCNQKPRFACPYCSYVTKRSFSVYGHVRYKHPDSQVGYVDIDDRNTLIVPQSS